MERGDPQLVSTPGVAEDEDEEDSNPLSADVGFRVANRGHPFKLAACCFHSNGWLRHPTSCVLRKEGDSLIFTVINSRILQPFFATLLFSCSTL